MCVCTFVHVAMDNVNETSTSVSSANFNVCNILIAVAMHRTVRHIRAYVSIPTQFRRIK